MLQSCGPEEFSFEDDDARRGLFTGKLLEALDGKADANGDGALSMLEILQYATEATKAAARKQFGESQTPHYKTSGTDFVLADGLKVDYLTKDARESGEALLAEAAAKAKAGDFDGALAKVDAALKLGPTGATLERWTTRRTEIEEDKATSDKLAAAEKARLDAEQKARDAEAAWLQAETARRQAKDEAASGGDFAKAQRYSDAAYASYQAKDYDAALRSINAALALVESSTFRKLKDSIESAKAKAESGVASPSSSVAQTSTPKPNARPTREGDWGDSTTRRAGTRKTLTLDGIEYGFCWCPPGEFEMGSPEDEEGREDGETRHTVKLPRGFWMLESEVTVGMWRSFVEDAGYQCGPGVDGQGGFGYDASTGKFGYGAKYTWDNPGFP